MIGQAEGQTISMCVQSVNPRTGTKKECIKCRIIKPVDDFNKNKGHKDGLEGSCRLCLKEYNKAYREAHHNHLLEVSRTWKAQNHEKHLAYAKQWRSENPDRHRDNVAKWGKRNPDKVKAAIKKWAKSNIDKVRAITRKSGSKLRSTPSGKLKRNMGSMMCSALKGRKSGQHWELLAGYSVEELKIHLEQLFQTGMTWDNYGKDGWEVDHKIPIAVFDFENKNEIIRCWSLDNLQPLWGIDNRRKGKKLIIPPCEL